MGRPTTYTPELAAKVCERVATIPVGLNKLCKMFDDMPDPTTIYLWRITHESFSKQYLEAKKFQSEIMVEEIDEMGDHITYYIDDKGQERIDPPSVALVTARANNRKWTASRLAPKIWGDKKELEQVQSENAEIKAELHRLRVELAEKNKKEY